MRTVFCPLKHSPHLYQTCELFWRKKKNISHSDFQQKQFISPLLLENDISPLKQTEKGKFVEQITQKEELEHMKVSEMLVLRGDNHLPDILHCKNSNKYI